MFNYIQCLILIFFFLLSCKSNTDLQYKITKGRIYNLTPDSDVFYNDLDNDAESELIIIETGDDVKFRIKINDILGDFHISSMPVFAKYLDCNFHDISGDKNKEVLFTYQSHDSLFLRIYEPYNENTIVFDKLIFIGVKHPNPEKDWSGSFTIEDFNDLNHDGHKDVLLVIAAGYPLYPRAIIAYDIFNRHQIWKYDLGPILEEPYIKDINNDGKYEIYINNWSPDNGAKANGTDDKHSYFIVLDENGKLIKQKEMGVINSSTSVLFADFGNGREEIITVTKNSNTKYTNDYQIVKWDWKDNSEILPVRVNDSFKILDHLIIPFQGTKTLLVSDWEKNLFLLDSDLKKIKSVKHKNAITHIKGFGDLNNDGSQEILGDAVGDSVVILNDTLELIAVSEGIRKYMTVEKGRKMSKGIAFLNSKNQLFEVFLKKKTLIDLVNENQHLIANFLLLLFLILSWIWIFLSKGNWKWYSKQLKHFNDAHVAVMILNRKLEIQSCNKSMEKLLWLETNVNNQPVIPFFKALHFFQPIGVWLEQHLPGQLEKNEQFNLLSPSREKNLFVQLHFIFSKLKRLEGVLIRINDLSPIVQSQKTSAWITVAQKLAHEIKNPLTTIQLSLQRMRMEYEDIPGLKQKLSEFIENSLDEVNRLRTVIDDFMHFSKIDSNHPQSFVLNDFIENLVIRFRLNLKEGVEIKTEIEKDLPAVKADPTHLSTLLTNLLDNAVQATTKGEINIKVTFQEKIKPTIDKFVTKSIQLEITDTGCGMDEETLQKIEQPFFTTKEGGSGLGLSIVKKIVEEHKGEFEIFSKQGLGTRVTVRLPLNNDNN